MDFSALKTRLQNPNFQDRLGGIGMALSGLDQGRVVDLSGVRDGIRQRQETEVLRESLNNPDLLSRFTPEQRQMLANMPPQAAQALIAETIFKAPDPAIAFREQLQASGALDRFTPEQQAVLMSLPPDQAQQVIADTLFAGPAAPVKGVEVGGNLVNPVTGDTIYEGQPQQGHRVLSVEEAAAMGLPPGSYQQDSKGKITSIGGGGQTINVQTGEGQGQGVIEIDKKTGRALIYDPDSESGMRWVNIPGGSSSQEAAKGDTQAQSMLSTIDGLLADSGLDSAVGITGAITQYMGSFAPEAVRARGRIDQIKGKAFLEAFDRLKGGGQITEIEGQKAEQAIARLNTAQSPDDFRDALMELRGVIESSQGGGQAPTATTDMSDADLLKMYSGGQ